MEHNTNPIGHIEKLFKQYQISKEGISVDFRKDIPMLNIADRYTHSIHSYPAKLITHIPFYFLNNPYFIKSGEVVLDPFCGSGTTLLEANLIGINAYGADANPLARLISKTKTTKLNPEKIIKLLDHILLSFKRIKKYEIPKFKNIDIWFSTRVQKELSYLYSAIERIKETEYKDFFLICFSSTLGKSSYMDPRISVPVRLNANRYPLGSIKRNKILALINKINTINVIKTFENICHSNIKRIASLNDIKNFGETKIISQDARRLTIEINSNESLTDECVDLILTSPPYASAQKYIRSSSLSLHWLRLLEGKSIVDLNNQNIGRENYIKKEIAEKSVGITNADKVITQVFKKNPLRGVIVCQYLLDMMKALNESVRVLKKDHHLILIIGNNNVCGLEFNTKSYLAEYLKSIGMRLELELVDDIKSYGLMTKRNKTANIITREWILIFKKL